MTELVKKNGKAPAVEITELQLLESKIVATEKMLKDPAFPVDSQIRLKQKLEAYKEHLSKLKNLTN